MIGIMREDLTSVSHFLNTSPLSIFETNYCGQTPVHIAVLAGNSSILKLVLSCSNEKLLNTMDSCKHYPIDYLTLTQFHKPCHAQRMSDCEGCIMLEALLNAGSGLFQRTLQIGFGLEHANKCNQRPNLSFAAREILLRHLKERRTRLQDLATKRLPKEQRRDLISPANCVLDRNAPRVQKLLEDQHSYIPSDLKVFNGHEDAEPSDSPRTIYAYISDQPTAKLAWGLGFQDIGIDSMDGLYHALRAILNSSELHQQVVQTHIDYISWLVHRGLDLNLLIPATLLPKYLQQRSDLRNTGAHYLMRLLGKVTTFIDGTIFTLPKNLSEIALSQFSVDSCSCPCSPSGCNPLMKYFDEYKYSHSRVGIPWQSDLLLMCKPLLRLVTQSERQGPSYTWIYQAILRRITFDALSLQHSCCNIHLFLRTPDTEEVAERWAQEKHRLLLFENLCVEFEAKCGGNSRLVQFVRDIWYPRMISELEHLERQEKEKRLSAEERLAAEEIGVVWDSDSYESFTSEDKDYEGALEYFTRMLDDIVPEPDMQLPYGFGLC
ncbi:hypothetical protein GCG54_00005317 [Colletotrichum gloeosporioides]|uniref:Ankyrin repeat protein n=1 Tax=Colletotrichum gloeosporioides TaxID=474922 RepID=A0A8H4CTQ7_COLGL|nr:uncharacterized protein GCG54_00005317 [Colletotrichum gloeosporioides]KAF3809774.1 hypothetical protein GCG54_00005317 [Colletotrichum gloeosporioides]